MLHRINLKTGPRAIVAINWFHWLPTLVGYHITFAGCHSWFWATSNLLVYEAVSDQGPVWVQSEEKIPSGFKSNPNIIFSMPRYSLVTQLSEKVWHVYSQIEWLRRYRGFRPENLPFFIKICESFLKWLLLICSFLA